MKTYLLLPKKVPDPFLRQRITEDFVAEERKAMGDAWVQQEYECLFTALEGLVYPELSKTYTDFWTPPSLGKPCGGIDWGWKNPFAAVWGVLDKDDVVWIQEERYLRETPLHEHAKALPKIMWYADPAGRTEIEEFRVSGHTIRKYRRTSEMLSPITGTREEAIWQSPPGQMRLFQRSGRSRPC